MRRHYPKAATSMPPPPPLPLPWSEAKSRGERQNCENGLGVAREVDEAVEVGGAEQAAYSPQGSGGVNSGSCRVRSVPRGKSGEYAGRVNTAALQPPARLFSPSISGSVTLLPEIRLRPGNRRARVRSHLHLRTGQAGGLLTAWPRCGYCYAPQF